MSATGRELFIALILSSGEAKLRIADSVDYPGHTDWIQRDQIALRDVIGGFSFIVDGGQVTGLFPASQMNRIPASQMNRTRDWRLDESQLQAMLGLLPMSAHFRLF